MSEQTTKPDYRELARQAAHEEIELASQRAIAAFEEVRRQQIDAGVESLRQTEALLRADREREYQRMFESWRVERELAKRKGPTRADYR